MASRQMVKVNSFLLTILVAIGITLTDPRIARATPELPLDDPTYLQLYQLQDRGLIPVGSLSGVGPLTEAQIQSLLRIAGQRPSNFLLDPMTRGFWLRPVDRVAGRFSMGSGSGRSYSLPARPRDMAGALALPCEHQEGRPCGDGAHGLVELDTSAGYGTWLSAFSRLQARTGSTDSPGTGLNFDRLYANLELGSAELFAGRNVVAIGPGRHTQLIWGTQPPPLDHAGVSIRSLKLPSVPIALGGAYLVGRLDAPQRFPHSIVTITRAYVEISEQLRLGITNLLLLGGQGAPHLTLGQFVEEHVYRTGPADSQGASDRRTAVDLTLQIRPLNSTFYTEIAFEDSRQQFVSALAYDTDYLVGWATSAVGRGRRYGFLAEFHRTGVRSQEHGLFTSGMTSGGRTMGPPLGPDATSLYISPRWEIARETVWLSPWNELVRIGSDIYDFPENAAIARRSSGPVEFRWRAGLAVLGILHPRLWLQADSFVEHVGNEAFQLRTRINSGLSLSVMWRGNGDWVGTAAR